MTNDERAMALREALVVVAASPDSAKATGEVRLILWEAFLGLARRGLRDPSHADDVVALTIDALIAAAPSCQALKVVDADDSAKKTWSWAHAALNNAIAIWLRKQKKAPARVNTHDLQALPGNAQDSDQIAEVEQDHSEAEELLKRVMLSISAIVRQRRPADLFEEARKREISTDYLLVRRQINAFRSMLKGEGTAEAATALDLSFPFDRQYVYRMACRGKQALVVGAMGLLREEADPRTRKQLEALCRRLSSDASPWSDE